MSAWAVIVAAGRGSRAGFGINKVYMKIKGGSVLETCLRTFDACNLFDGITVVISESDRMLFDTQNIPKSVKRVVNGGKTRQESVFNGLKSVPEGVDIVAVHDAARPYVTSEVIGATIDSARQFGSGVISTPVTDTIKQVTPDGSVATPDRSSLFAVQTPQTFNRKLLLEAHEWACTNGIEATDDAALFEKKYGNVRMVTCESAILNKKFTYKSDFAEDNMPDMRIGHGYDAHRLVEGRKLVLCGVEIPYEKGLDGHSDADVAVHALMDAMLGAAAMGDIGRLFPDNDDKYLGISSMLLLEKTRDRLAAAGYRVSNADITIIAQRPKLMGYIDTMRENVARTLKIDTSRVNVKATTTEKMGFEGAGEGISSHAVVMLTGE